MIGIFKTMRISIVFYQISLVYSLFIDPTNETCFLNAEYAAQYIDSLQTEIRLFSLSPFSQTFIEIDLRHMNEIPTNADGSAIFTLYIYLSRDGRETTSNVANMNTQINIFSMYVKKQSKMGIYFSISDQYSAYKYLLKGSVSVSVILQNQRVPSESSSFLFLIQNLDDVNLPYNRPALSSTEDYYLDQVPSVTSSSRLTTIQSSNDYWDTYSSFAVPYIPYFSNCHGEPLHIYLSQVMQNSSDCDLISLSDTVPIQQFKFGSTPTADTCIINRNCVYDEVAGLTTEFPYWMTLPDGNSLFYITKDKVESSQYSINKEYDNTQVVKCKIIASQGTNSSDYYPLKVKLILEYYQMSKEAKRMINCSIEYSLYVQSKTDFEYQLQIETKPLNHTYIMLNFGFQWYVYMIIFLVIGIVSNLQNFILWLFHSCVSRKEKKPFRIKIYLNIIKEIVQGTLIPLFLFIILLFSVTIIMNGKIFDATLYETALDPSIPRVFWDSITLSNVLDYDASNIVNLRAGRMGLSFLLIGAFIIFYTSKYFIGKEKATEEYKEFDVMGRKFRPIDWNQGKFLFGTFVFITLQFIFIYFAYSSIYSQNIWAFIVCMKIIQIFMEQITKSVYEDLLPCLPLKVLTDITAYMNTLSANNFYDFLFSFLIDVAITMIEKAYISQLQNIVVEKIQQKMEQIQKFYANLINDTEDEATQIQTQKVEEELQENQNIYLQMRGEGETDEINFFEEEQVQLYHESEDESEERQNMELIEEGLRKKLKLYLKKSNKLNQLGSKANNNTEEVVKQKSKEDNEINERSSIFQMLLDNIIMIFTFLLQPFVVLVFWITYDESLILSKYGISSNTVILYLLSAVVIAIFTIINVVLIFHLLQSYLQIDFEEPITELLTRFQNRSVFWKANDEDINIRIGTTLRGADHYCLSFQFFFIMTIYISSMILIMLGLSIMMNVSYNPFQDVATIPVILFWYMFLIFFIWFFKQCALKVNFWNCSDYENISTNINKVEISLKEDGLVEKQKQNGDDLTNHNILINDNSESEMLEVVQKQNRKSKSKTESLSIFSAESENLTSKEWQRYSEQSIMIKLETICRKLQTSFQNNKFMLEYFVKNKQFVKEKLSKILPLMEELPQIKEYKSNIKNQIDEINSKKESKNLEPNVIDILMVWKNYVEIKAKEKNKFALQLQGNIKKCYYCYQQWGIYFYLKEQGMCLNCSHHIFEVKNK